MRYRVKHEKVIFIFTSGHVICCLLYKHQWNTRPFHFNILIVLRAIGTILRMRSNLIPYFTEQSFSIDLVRRVKIWILILKTCLVIHERLKQHIVCFELNIVEKYDVLKGAFSKQVETKATFTLKSSCLGGKKRKTDERWENEYRKLYMAADANASWTNVKRKCFYYPTALRRVQITLKTSTNITRYLYSRRKQGRFLSDWLIC